MLREVDRRKDLQLGGAGLTLTPYRIRTRGPPELLGAHLARAEPHA